jgi:hypothetical protein
MITHLPPAAIQPPQQPLLSLPLKALPYLLRILVIFSYSPSLPFSHIAAALLFLSVASFAAR